MVAQAGPYGVTGMGTEAYYARHKQNIIKYELMDKQKSMKLLGMVLLRTGTFWTYVHTLLMILSIKFYIGPENSTTKKISTFSKCFTHANSHMI